MKKNKLVILIFLVILILVILAIFNINKIYISIKSKSIVNYSMLDKYSNSYIGDNSNVLNIINLLPYSKYLDSINLKTDTKPYELIIDYVMNGSEKKLEYNSLILFSLIQNLDTITYNLDNITISISRDTYINICSLNLESIKEHINSEKIWGDNVAYTLTINKNGMTVFEDPNLALNQLKKDYTTEISTIQKEFNIIFKPNVLNYSKYKTYGWQVTSDNSELNLTCSKVSSFFDIFENSINNETYNPY